MSEPDDPRGQEPAPSPARGGEGGGARPEERAHVSRSEEVHVVRPRTAWGPGGWARRLTALWGFLGFCILILVLARHVVVPFIFALLLAYILAPVVRRLSVSASGTPRMPRGLAIVFCYVVLLALMTLFLFALLPRLSKDVARIGAEAPALYHRINSEWTPAVADWVEARFPSFRVEAPDVVETPAVADVPLPPGTQFVFTPLPDGRYAVQLQPAGIEIRPVAEAYVIMPREEAPIAERLDDRLRAWTRDAFGSLQGQVGGVFRMGQAVVTAVVSSIFAFFLVLMIAAFILLDIERIHAFVRGLVPAGYRDDYDQIAAGIDRGLSGVIRGQLMICLINGILTYIGLLIFDIKYAIILAIVAAVLSLIPIFGSILSTLPIVLAALVSDENGLDVARALFILLWIVGIHFVEANLLNPKIIGSAAKIHPVLVIFALVVGEHSFGLTGALLAVPAIAVVQVFFLFFRRKMWRGEATAGQPAAL